MSDDRRAARSEGKPERPAIAVAKSCHAALSGLIARRPFITLFGAGAISTLAMAPLHLWPVLFLTLPVFYWALDDAGPEPERAWRRAAWRGWAFGFGYHFAGLYWIGFSFLVQAERFAALMPFAIVLLTASLALFFGAAAALHALVRPRLSSVMARIFLLALVVMAAEWLRGHILTGFPWNILGTALTMPLVLMQWVGLFGIYVLTAFTIVILAAPLVVLASPCRRPWLTILGTTIAPIGFATVYGLWQLAVHPTLLDNSVRLRLVQPSFSQKDKFEAAKRGEIFLRHLELSTKASESASGNRPTHVIWPEAAIPFFVRRSRASLAAIDNALPDDVKVIAGTFRTDIAPDIPNERITSYRVFNTAMAIGGDGRVEAFYDKIHLVPFGEYLPARRILNALGLENLTRTSGGLARGRGPRNLMRIAGLPPVAMLICYEASFPNEVVQGEERPGLMINLTNDAWFGDTSGPHQHFHQTRLRAVEQGVAVLRSANSGISAIVDPMGRVLARLALNRVGTVDGLLPNAIRAPIYARHRRFVETAAFLAIFIYLIAHALFRPGYSF